MIYLQKMSWDLLIMAMIQLNGLFSMTRQICNNHWIYHCGRPVNRSFRYFMQGSEVLVFAKGSNNDSLVRLLFQSNSYQSEQIKEKESISYILQCWNFKNKIGRISFFTWHECFWRFKHKPFPKKFTNSNFTRWCDSWTISGCVTTTTSESPDSFRSLKTIPTSFRSTSRERRTLSSWAKRFVSSFEVFLAKIRKNFSRLWRSTFGLELSTWTTKEIDFEKWAGSIV